MSDVSLIYGNSRLNESLEKKMSFRMMRKSEKVNNRNSAENKKETWDIYELKNHELENLNTKEKITKSKESNHDMEKNTVNINTFN